MVTSIVNLRTLDVDIETWSRDPNNIYIGRPSRWGNPFKLSQESSREEVVKNFEKYIRGNSELLQCIKELRGKSLGCWCYPKLCHGVVLHRLAENTRMDEDICDRIVSKISANFNERFDEIAESTKNISNDILNIRKVLIDNLI